LKGFIDDVQWCAFLSMITDLTNKECLKIFGMYKLYTCELAEVCDVFVVFSSWFSLDMFDVDDSGKTHKSGHAIISTYHLFTLIHTE